jgi:glycopeptide antibiotics resistance protein
MWARVIEIVKNEIVGISLTSYIGMSILCVIVVLIVCVFMQKKRSRTISPIQKGWYMLFLCYVAFMVMITLSNRDSGSRGELHLIPFSLLFQDDKVNIYSAVYAICNVIFFIPFGVIITLSKRLSKVRYRLVVISFLCLSTSMSIELTQLVTKRGYFETEDLICNTIGGIIGAIAVLVCKKLTTNTAIIDK